LKDKALSSLRKKESEREREREREFISRGEERFAFVVKNAQTNAS